MEIQRNNPLLKRALAAKLEDEQLHLTVTLRRRGSVYSVARELIRSPVPHQRFLGAWLLADGGSRSRKEKANCIRTLRQLAGREKVLKVLSRTLRSIGTFHSPTLDPFIAALRRHQSAIIRLAVAQSFSFSGTTAAITSLLLLLKDRDSQ